MNLSISCLEMNIFFFSDISVNYDILSLYSFIVLVEKIRVSLLPLWFAAGTLKFLDVFLIALEDILLMFFIKFINDKIWLVS